MNKQDLILIIMKKNSNNYKESTAIGKYTEVLKCPELGALSGVR